MKSTDTSERGLERLICSALTDHACDPGAEKEWREWLASYAADWLGSDPEESEPLDEADAIADSEGTAADEAETESEESGA